MSRDETRTFCQCFTTNDYSPKNLSEREQKLYDAFLNYVAERLGNNHPLALSIKRGVAYHHGRLSKDVRDEIEYAISKKWIRVIASTTTLIDGVNFPITTFILANYEKVIGRTKPADKSEKPKPITRRLEKKDFQNMIGRAGRAVFDTEGQIIFVSPENPLSHDVSWQDYMFTLPTDRERMVLSSLNRQDFDLTILKDMLDSLENSNLPLESLSVDPDELGSKYGPNARNIGETILKLQAFLLIMMDRDILEPSKLETFIAFLERTLFGQQSPTAALFDTVAQFAQATGKNILLAEPSKQKRSTYSKVGLGFRSCHMLYDYSQIYWDSYAKNNFDQNMEHITEEFIEKLGDFIFSLPELRPDGVHIPHKKPSPIIELSHGKLLTDWIVNSMSISSIRENYFGAIPDIGESTEACINYIQDAFEYKAPWALSAFNMFISKISQNDDFVNSSLAKQLSMLPAYAKFGVNNPAAALFSMMGVSARHVSILLAEQYNIQNPTRNMDFSGMVDWLLKLEPEQVYEWFESSFGNGDNAGYVPRLFRFLDSIRSQEQSLDGMLPLEIEVAGWKYYKGGSVLSLLHIHDTLMLKLDPLNPWDSYAVEIYDQFDNKLGFVPRRFSRAVYLYLASDGAIKSEIASIETKSTYSPVKILLTTE